MLQQQLDSHEKVCAERYEAIHEKIAEIKIDFGDRVGELKRILAWGGIFMVSCIVGALAWSLRNQYDAIEANQRRYEAQMQLIQSQVAPQHGVQQPAPTTPAQ